MPEQPGNTEAAELSAESAVDPAVATAVDAPEPVAVVDDQGDADAAAEPADEVGQGDADAAAAPVDEAPEPEPAAPVVHLADEVLLGSTALAQRALLEVTSPESVGSVIGHIAEGEHVLSLHFAADLAGYPGWHWSVTVARVDDGEPTVLETELMPGDRALLAPEWVPWSERLADYRAAQQAAAAAGAAASEGEPDDELVDDETDESLDDLGDELGEDDDELDEDEDEDEDEDLLDDDEDELEDVLDDALDEDDLDGIDIDALDEDESDESDDDESDENESDEDDLVDDESDEDD